MEQLLEFVTNHPILILLFVILSTMLIKTLLADVGQGGTHVEASEATRLLNRENAVFLDIRPAAEFSDGHIINATNIPFSEFDSRSADLDKLRDRPLIICCKSGTTSSQAAAALKKLNFEKVYRLKAGVEGWKHANLPLST